MTRHTRLEDLGRAAKTVFPRSSILGPVGLFGRGRGLSFLMMGAVTLFSYISRETERPLTTEHVANDIQTPGGEYLSHQTVSYEASRSTFRDVRSVLPASQGSEIVAHHGGVIGDARARQLQSVGNRLAAAVSNYPQGTLKFYMLADANTPQAYVLDDGAVLMTIARYHQLNNESELAAVVSRQITQFAFRDQPPSCQQDAFRFEAQLLAAAGYSSPNIHMASDQRSSMR